MPLYFEPAFDDLAQQFQQTPGSMLALPQHTPYRNVNEDGLSVTLTTKYMTRESERRNNAHRANHILNRFFPSDKRSIATSGLRSAANRLLLANCRIPAGRDIASIDGTDISRESGFTTLRWPADNNRSQN